MTRAELKALARELRDAYRRSHGTGIQAFEKGLVMMADRLLKRRAFKLDHEPSPYYQVEDR